MLQDKVLITEGLSVNGLPPGAVPLGEVSSLNHELGDNAVEHRPFVMQLLARLASAPLTGAEAAEILSTLRSLVREELEGDPPEGLAAGVDIEVD